MRASEGVMLAGARTAGEAYQYVTMAGLAKPGCSIRVEFNGQVPNVPPQGLHAKGRDTKGGAKGAPIGKHGCGKS